MFHESDETGIDQTTGIRYVIFVNYSCENASAYNTFINETTIYLFSLIE